MKSVKYFIFILIAFTTTQAYSQSNKKKSGQYVISISPGMAYGEASNEYTAASFYGPHLNFCIRKRVIKLSKNYNFSSELHLGSQFAFLENDKKLYGYRVGQLVFNFNALAGSYPPNKKNPISFPIGFFIGPGIYLLNGGYNTADIGPLFNLGFRFKMSKTYFFDLRFFGAFTVFGETAIGGASLQFPIMLRKTSGGK
jgi:hypothetical protein